MDETRAADNWRIGKDNTALIVVDMQNMWVDPRGCRYLPSSEDIIPKIQEILKVCRSSEVPVIYLYTTKRKDLGGRGRVRRPEADDP